MWILLDYESHQVDICGYYWTIGHIRWIYVDITGL